MPGRAQPGQEGGSPGIVEIRRVQQIIRAHGCCADLVDEISGVNGTLSLYFCNGAPNHTKNPEYREFGQRTCVSVKSFRGESSSGSLHLVGHPAKDSFHRPVTAQAPGFVFGIYGRQVTAPIPTRPGTCWPFCKVPFKKIRQNYLYIHDPKA